MNVPWQGITQIRAPEIFAQTSPAPVNPVTQPEVAVERSVNYLQDIGQNLAAFIPNLIAAVLILLVGLIVAAIAKSIVRGILNRTNIDNRIAAGVMGRPDTGDLPKVEDFIANLVYWIVILFTVIAVLQALQLQVVSQPLGQFLNTILSYIPRVLGALIFLAVAWLIATVVKFGRAHV